MSAITGAGFRAFAAAAQGDWDRAAAAIADIPIEEWNAFVTAVMGLHAAARLDMDRVRKHRVCDNCLKANHDRCTDPCGCAVDHHPVCVQCQRGAHTLCTDPATPGRRRTCWCASVDCAA